MEMAGFSGEHQRLAASYARMTDGELQNVAAAAASLTDIAFEALGTEMLRRGLTPPPAPTPAGTDGIEQRSLVTLRSFRDLPEALLARGMLDSSVIDSFLADDIMVRMDWFISNLLGGIKLRVSPDDLAAATEVLDQPVPEGFEVDGVGEYQQPRCPKCQSIDVAFEELNKPIAYGTAWIGFHLPIHRKLWNCHACGHSW
jgi:hypothetical protein